MKTFQKITLAAAISAAPFMAQAELTPMDDALMGATTGQAGVTVEINIDGGGISVGEIEYTDEGSVAISDVAIKNVTNLTQTIDVNADGDLEIGMSGINGMTIEIGDTAADVTGASSAVALRSTGGAETELVNNIDMTLNVGSNTTYIRNLASRSAADLVGTGAGQLGLPAAAAGGSVAIQTTAAIQITDMNVGAFGYTQAQAGAKINGYATAAADGSLTAQERADALAAYNVALDNGGFATVATAGDITAATTGQATAVLANGAAVNVTGVQFYNMADTDNNAATPDVKSYATIDQTIWAQGGKASNGGGVYIQIGQINGTLEVGGIELGGTSIGSVKVSDINLAGLTQRIYGHN